MRAHGIATEEELIERSTADVEWFWDAVVPRPRPRVLRARTTAVLDTSRGVEWATWFTGGTVNLAHNCVDRWAERTPDAHRGRLGGRGGRHPARHRTRELREMARTGSRTGSRALGVRRGDAVGIFLPMVPETVAAMLACAKLGAIFLPIFSGLRRRRGRDAARRTRRRRC